jgi:hypothetical protein
MVKSKAVTITAVFIVTILVSVVCSEELYNLRVCIVSGVCSEELYNLRVLRSMSEVLSNI